jgi:hypothetical protein
VTSTLEIFVSDHVAREFDAAMLQVYERAWSETRYRATRFLQILNEYRGVETVNRLLPTMSEGFAELWRRNRLDLTMEALIIQGKWRSLFTPAQLESAEQRLRDCGYREIDAPR